MTRAIVNLPGAPLREDEKALLESWRVNNREPASFQTNVPKPAEIAQRPLTPGERIVQAAEPFFKLRGKHGSDRALFRSFGISTNEQYCVNFVRAICGAAGLRAPSSAHVSSIPEVGTKVRPQDIKPGDIAMNSQHTGIVYKVYRDAHGNATAYDFFNGNTWEGGMRQTVGMAKISLSHNPYTLYRHNGEESKVAPPAFIAERHGIRGSTTAKLYAAGWIAGFQITFHREKNRSACSKNEVLDLCRFASKVDSVN